MNLKLILFSYKLHVYHFGMNILHYVYIDECKHKVGSKVIVGQHYQSDSEKALSRLLL